MVTKKPAALNRDLARWVAISALLMAGVGVVHVIAGIQSDPPIAGGRILGIMLGQIGVGVAIGIFLGFLSTTTGDRRINNQPER